MQLQRSSGKAFSEGLIEWTIRVSGISAVVFVFAIFIFVFWEGKGLLFSDDFSISELLTSEKWDPTTTRRATVLLRIILGTFSVAIVAMIITVPFSLGGRRFHFRILRSTVEGNSKSSHRTIGCNSFCGLGVYRTKDHLRVHERTGGRCRCVAVKRCYHSSPDEHADYCLHQ